MAGGIAVVGLLTNSSPYILASFFISPLMSMIVATTWGLTIQNFTLVKQGLRNMAIGIAICFMVGLLAGLLLSISPNPEALSCPVVFNATQECQQYRDSIYAGISINSGEILSRGPPWANLALSVPIAAFSGVAIAVGQSSGIASALAGCALSTSLLPPIVNSGLLLGLLAGYPHLHTMEGDSLARVAWYSGLLYVVNVFWIIVMSYTTFKWKHIGGKTLRNMSRHPSLSMRATTPSLVQSHDSLSDVYLNEIPAPMNERGTQLSDLQYIDDESEESCFQELMRDSVY
eukprot:TRINITY_DN17105_c0_g1_i1.p1 TRINITY_DN17105_c0_g1~~TRINITY_DN17105_c0_g1_i1.p1  ORF type:complete len:288 (-),score=56.42 TRINITY_DN17105_c0_g1_i1:296-1159(-)